jgi:hypothetical protein
MPGQSEATTLTDRFSSYFDQPVAQMAAKSLSDGCEIEFRVGSEVFTFTKKSAKNVVVPGPALNPHLIFTMTLGAAEEILAQHSDKIAEIGIHIAKMVISKDPDKHIKVEFKAGFFTLFARGYLGVVTAGGAGFASYLASNGLNGIAAIKSLLGKTK